MTATTHPATPQEGTVHTTSTTTESTGSTRSATTARRRPSGTARLTGVAYLGIIVAGIVAEFVVRGSLVVADDPTATATNVAGSPGLFRFGIAADALMVVLDATVAIGLFLLLRHANRRLALAATVLRLVQGAVIALNLVNLVRALGLAQDAVAGDGTVLAGPAQGALDAIERHALLYDTGLIAFGLCCLVLGHLLLTHRLVSRWLAIGMSATGVVYLTGSFAALFAPGLSAAIDPFYFIAIVVEPAFAIRLIVRGLDTPDPVATTARPAAVAA